MARSIRAIVIVSAIGTAACRAEQSPSGLPPVVPPVRDLTLNGGVQPILTRTCAFAGCHGGPSPQAGLHLGTGRTFTNVVGVPSTQVPRLLRVAPSTPDSSYVILKLEGLAGGVGGIGTQMPLGGQLTAAQIDTIRAWIRSGAANN